VLVGLNGTIKPHLSWSNRVPTISATAGAIFYLKRGNTGPPLICIHGAGGTHQHWGYQLRGLSDIARVYTLDLPGHGRSAPPGRDTIAGYVKVVLAIMDRLDIRGALLIGHSMGGAIALQAALDAPERVLGLGLIGAGGRMRVAPAILDGLSGDRLATINTIVEYAYAPDAPERIRRQAAAAYALCDPTVYRGDYLACDAFDVLSRLGEIGCPAAVVCGTADRMTPPKYAEALRDRIRGSTLTLIASAGHMAPIERPAEVTAALRELITRLKTGSGVSVS
jgi:pimeloyl-ACP methyl ester carboxylesterase